MGDTFGMFRRKYSKAIAFLGINLGKGLGCIVKDVKMLDLYMFEEVEVGIGKFGEVDR